MIIENPKIKIKLLVVFALFCIFFILNCSEDKKENPAGPQGGPPPAGLVGTWTFQSVTLNRVAASLGSVLDWNSATVLARVNVASNGAYVYEEVDSSGGQLVFESGLVIVTGNSIEINITLNNSGPVDESTTATYTLNGNVLTLQAIELGITAVFTLTR